MSLDAARCDPNDGNFDGSPNAEPATGWRAHTQDWRNGYARGYQAALSGRANRGVRIREGEFEMRCASCANGGGTTAYWPLTIEFWSPRNLTVCRACLAARKRLAAKRAYWADPERHRERAREYHVAQAEVIRLKKRARYAENPEEHRAANVAWKAANADAVRAYRRAHYAKNREHILLREKLRRAGVAA